MADLKIKYATAAAITISVASLATSATRTAGQESTQLNNTVNLYDDAFVRGFITVGTTPTVAKQIDIWVYGSNESLQTAGNEIDVFDGTDSAETITSERVRNSALKLAAVIEVDATSDRKYFVQFSVAALFGGVVPSFWGLFIAHDTAVALNATAGNHEFEYTGIQYQSV